MDFSNHPCFDAKACKTSARVHLPVAPACNTQCNYCDRKYDCVQESRPGVTSVLLRPEQALAYLRRVMALRNDVAVTGIAGPGDPFATPDATLESFRLVREAYPDMMLCVASNGLALAPHADALGRLGLSHATVTVNSIRPETCARIYAWARDGARTLRGEEAGRFFVARQAEAVQALVAAGVLVKVNTILIPGVNDGEVAEVAAAMTKLGAKLMNLIPMIPVAGTPFGELPAPGPGLTANARLDAKKFLPQMSHCRRCRADAVGLLGEVENDEIREALRQSAHPAERPFVAAATREGAFVNRHLGETDQLAVYRREADAFHLVEIREVPATGGGAARWRDLASRFPDCRAVLVSGAGSSPTRTLEAVGIRVMVMEGLLEDGLEAAFEGREIPSSLRPASTACGQGCGGTGLGCS